MDRSSTASSFGADLGQAAAAWRRDPRLPLLSAAVTVLVAQSWSLIVLGSWSALPGGALVVALAAALTLLLYAGWIGTERIWYLQVWRGTSMQISDAARFTRLFAFRFLALGGVMVGLALPFLFIGAFLEVQARSTGAQVLNSLIGIAAGIFFTFVVPALAYRTTSVGEAVRQGLRMLVDEWPRAAPYMLVPPLLIAPFTYGVVPRLHVGMQVPAFVVLALAALLFKGAIAAFYLRRHEVGPDGAAFESGAPGTD